MEKQGRYIPGTILECIRDVESYSDCGKLLFAKGEQYTMQADYSIMDETGHNTFYIDSELFKRRAFKRMVPRYFVVTCMYQISPTNCTTATASVIQDNGKYINSKELIAQLKKINKTSDTIIITNIIELSKEDYDEYNRK